MRRRMFTILIPAFLLTGCFGSTRSDGPGIVAETSKVDRGLVRERPPAEDRRPCDDPVALPRRKLSAGEVERHWSADRFALVDCAGRHERTLDYYEDRDARVSRGSGGE